MEPGRDLCLLIWSSLFFYPLPFIYILDIYIFLFFFFNMSMCSQYKTLNTGTSSTGNLNCSLLFLFAQTEFNTFFPVPVIQALKKRFLLSHTVSTWSHCFQIKRGLSYYKTHVDKSFSFFYNRAEQHRYKEQTGCPSVGRTIDRWGYLTLIGEINILLSRSYVGQMFHRFVKKNPS